MYGSSPSQPHRKKKMDTLFLGISHVVPGGVLRVPRRVPTGAYDRKGPGKSIYEKHDPGFKSRYGGL